MSKTIDGRVVNCNVDDAKNAKPFWDRIKGVADEATRRVKKGVNEVVIPAVGLGVTNTLVLIDKGCEKFANSEVEFLKKYPGIAMVLAQDTVLKVAVAQHVKQMVNDGCVDVAESASVINS